jgi:hypothetical protein
MPVKEDDVLEVLDRASVGALANLYAGCRGGSRPLAFEGFDMAHPMLVGVVNDPGLLRPPSGFPKPFF